MIFILLLSPTVFAVVELGVGMNSLTAGRVIPALEVSYSSGDSLYSWNGSGVRNFYYYQTAHQISYFKTWNSGTLWGGNITSGFGGSAAYVSRSFKDEGSLVEENSSDFIIGPALRMNWSYGFVFISMTATFGLRDLWQHISGLTFQDIESLSIG
ncbi:MAG TPA: hypothetical protein PLJ21_00320, partial [Pseudobdellovibrionaceae bacterium]|nr:hypothetical protein [Pseudobdellovibrionaceae bacterium]